jgi:2-dehydro-3-deoxygalactonokinase
VGASTLIAIDWGTTAARAYRMNARGEIRGERSAPLGISSVRDGRYDEALADLLGEWQADPAPRLACGMIGSRQGWVEAPYVACPASLDALAEGIVVAGGRALSIVPGLATRDRHGVPDVMRGEETQLVGAVAADEAAVLATLPGTHSKWAWVERGRVVDFVSYLTGEIYAVLLEHSILGRMARTDRAAGAGAGFARGVQRGLAEGFLAHDVFGARTLALAGELAATEVADWLSGLLIGREIRAALAWAREYGFDAQRVRVIGSDALCNRYAAALAQVPIVAERGDPAAAARGLWRIAGQAGLIH